MEDILFDLYYKQLHRNEELQNDLKQSQNEIKLLNKQIDKLITENNQLKFNRKMLTKVHMFPMNSIYGITATVYTDTDSIKETKDNDSDN